MVMDLNAELELINEWTIANRLTINVKKIIGGHVNMETIILNLINFLNLQII